MSVVRSKTIAYRTMYYSGAHLLFRRLMDARGAILMFHRVVSEPVQNDFSPNEQFVVTPDMLATIIETLRAAGYEIVSLDDACQRMAGQIVSSPFACLTFDDGYRDNLELAYPVCSRMNAPFAVYVATGFISGTDPLWSHGLEALLARETNIEAHHAGQKLHFATGTLAAKRAAFASLGRLLQISTRADRHRFMQDLSRRYDIDFAAVSAQLAMTWDMLKELDQLPGVTIGAHTVSHPALCELSAEEARFEMAESRRVLELALNHPIRHFAYPFGDITTTGEREFKLCQDLGFATAVTTRHQVLTTNAMANPHALPRIPTDPFESAMSLRTKLTGLPGALKSIKQRLVKHRQI